MKKADAWVAELKIGVRIWIERNGKPVLGKGRVELLAAIGRTASISAAARELKMSYRHACNMVQEINERAGAPLVESAVGGKRGGGATLTEQGRRAVRLFEDLQSKVGQASATALERSIAKSAKAPADDWADDA